jgi:hypothetical protein
MQEMEWYSVRSIFRADVVEDGRPRRVFEERVVVFQAASFEEALAKGEAEARGYCEGSQQACLLDHVVAFSLQEKELCEGTEVWSCLRDLDLTDEAYLERFYEGEGI